MSLTKAAAAVRIRRLLRDAETKADAALQASSALMTTMIDARAIDGVEVNLGQTAIIRLARAQQAFVDGTSGLFRVHDEMVRIGREMGIMDEETPASGLSDDDMVRKAA